MRTLARIGTATLVIAAVSGRVSAQPQIVIRVAPMPVQGAPPVDPSGQEFVDEFDLAVLKEAGPQAATAARSRLNEILERKIVALDRTHGLSGVQRQKLRLAGRGDIQRLDDRLERLRQKFVAAHRTGTPYSAAIQMDALSRAVKTGPFGEDSLFVKAQKTILSAEQLAKFERRRRLAAQSTKRISIDNARSLETIARFRKDVYGMVWRREGDEFGTLEFDNVVQICSGDELRPRRTIGAGHKLVGFDFCDRRDVAAIAENSTKAFLVKLSTGKETALETGNRQPSVSISPDGKLVATGGYGTKAAVWSVESGRRIRDIDAGPAEGGLTPLFSPNGKILAVGNRNSSTRLFDLASGRMLHVLPWQSSHELKFDPAGKRLAVAYVDGQLAVWSVESGDLLQRVTARAKELFSLDWSPDGKIIASSGLEASLALWNAADLRLVNEIESPEWVICVRFNPQGTRLIYAGGSQVAGGERYVEVLGVP